VSEYLDVVEVLLPPGTTVAQLRELLLHSEHAIDAHSENRRAIEHAWLVVEGPWREQRSGSARTELAIAKEA
jgi:hypothetical protein